MTLRKIESFDHIITAQLGRKWIYLGQVASTVASGGRNGTSGFSSSALSYDGLEAQFSSSHATWICGMAFKLTTPVNGDARLISFFDEATTQVYLYLTSQRRLGIARGDGTSLGVGTTQLPLDSYVYIEFKSTINNSTGSGIVRINQIEELNLTNQDTQNSGNATANRVRFQGMQVNNLGMGYMDDIYICDGAGSTNNDFLGDIRVQALLPNGNGNSSQFVGSDADSTDNYLLVDETTPNSDTDYVQTATVGQKDTYTYGNLTPTTGTVFGVQVLPFVKKTDAGSRTVASVARLSGTEEDSSDKVLSTDYEYLPDVRETKPGGGSWSISDVNSAEFGLKVTA